MISHDSDVNDDDSAYTTLSILQECGIRSTWCMMQPGYSSELYPVIHENGHELALHYNARKEDDGHWGKEEFKRQLQWAKEVTGQEILSNKNHYTLFEGWGELFDWCEGCGIQSDQTRGPSKKGNVGFLFGTCHPYFPIAWADQKNRFYDIVEIGFLTQDVDLSRLADSSIIEPLLARTKEVRGVAHFLFHQIHLYREPKVKEALKNMVQHAKKMGYEFWTGSEINHWVRKRSKMVIEGLNEHGEAIFKNGCEKAVICIPVQQKKTSNQYLTRFGVSCLRQVVCKEETQ